MVFGARDPLEMGLFFRFAALGEARSVRLLGTMFLSTSQPALRNDKHLRRKLTTTEDLQVELQPSFILFLPQLRFALHCVLEESERARESDLLSSSFSWASNL